MLSVYPHIPLCKCENVLSNKSNHHNHLFIVQLPVCLEKSKRRAIERPLLSSSPGEVSLRLRLLALTVGPVESISTLPSTSSNGRAVICVVHFGSLEGKVGYGRAKK